MIITMHFCINCSIVICSPSIILMLSWEKPLVKPMASGSIFHHISFQSILHLASFRSTILQSLLSNLYHKNTKNIYLIIIISIRSHSCKWSWRDWQPHYRVGCEVLICLCRYEGFTCSLLLDWYLGSQKLREILTLLLLHHPLLFEEISM